MTQDLLTHAPAAVAATPAGWYADPADANTLRWWSGAGWTEHTAMATPPAVQQSAVPAANTTTTATPTATPAATPTSTAAATSTPPSPSVAGAVEPAAPMSRRQLRELAQRAESPAAAASAALFTAQTASGTPPMPSPAFHAVPATHAASTEAHAETPAEGTIAASSTIDLRDESGYVDVSVARSPVSVFTPLWPTRVHTVAVWLIALLPVLLAAFEEASSILLVGVSSLTVHAAGAGALIVLSALLALLDRHMLRAGGHSDTASPWWTFLSPFAYLVARSIRVRQETSVRSTGPALIWVVSLLPAIALVVGVSRIEAMIPSF